jgi:hypothetical protein
VGLTTPEMKPAITSHPSVGTAARENFARRYRERKTLIFIFVTELVVLATVAVLQHGRRKSVLIGYQRQFSRIFMLIYSN